MKPAPPDPSEDFRKFLQPVKWQEAPLEIPDRFSQKHFTLYRVVTPTSDTGLFTGYYEPELKGSFEKDATYRYPIYAPPDDVTRFSRAEIQAGALEETGMPILYCANKIELFFMHIQGSGAIRLPDGTLQRVRFAAKNGRPYTAIGKVLRERGLLQPPITMQTITAWLSAHADNIDEIFACNESFIFFQLSNASGPIGAAGEILKPEESLAVDCAIWPYGLSMIVETTDPLTGKPFIRLMKTVDTGSAIKGPIRGDIFFGNGEEAALKAGAMQAKGRLWLLLPDA